MLMMVRQRYSTDCGVAALAMAMGYTWDESYYTLHYFVPGWPAPGNDVDGHWYLGITQDTMVDTLALLTEEDGLRESGVPLTSARGPRGVLLVHGETEDSETTHWLAWEKEASGKVTIYNPHNGEVFDSMYLHNRGYRMVCHISVEG